MDYSRRTLDQKSGLNITTGLFYYPFLPKGKRNSKASGRVLLLLNINTHYFCSISQWKCFKVWYPLIRHRAEISLILAAAEHILGLENGAKRYPNEVTALSKAFAIAIPHEQAMAVKDRAALFQAVKARLAKVEATVTGKISLELETTIKH